MGDGLMHFMPRAVELRSEFGPALLSTFRAPNRLESSDWNGNAMDDGTRNGAGRWERRRAGRSDTQEPEGEAQLCTRHESWEQPSEAVDRAGLGSRDPGAQGRASCH